MKIKQERKTQKHPLMLQTKYDILRNCLQDKNAILQVNQITHLEGEAD